MPMTECDRVGFLNQDVQRARILLQHSSLSRVEQQSSTIPFHPERDTMFGEQPVHDGSRGYLPLTLTTFTESVPVNVSP